MRGVNDDEAPDAAAVLPRARLRAAVHRADAARRPARLEARPRWSPPTRSSSRCPPRSTLSPDTERTRGAAPAETFLVDGGPARVGVIASRHPPVLRRLRPGAAHRRRADPQLPVRPVESRPARAAARRRDGRGDRRPLARGHRGASCPGTASTTRPSSSRTARCPRSAADPAHRLHRFARTRPQHPQVLASRLLLLSGASVRIDVGTARWRARCGCGGGRRGGVR